MRNSLRLKRLPSASRKIDFLKSQEQYANATKHGNYSTAVILFLNFISYKGEKDALPLSGRDPTTVCAR
ncbi:MAG: hypothetical protein A2351_01855 [Omnitrophica bacterium RIFOXYB12_FULL_50_7]|nr:MAG: hypothetical protein A2351_01855 [Omnitrophica bacterium RIFOXYB12_FULL_50_7]